MLTTNADTLRGERAPLFYLAPGERDPMPAVLELDPQSRRLGAFVAGEVSPGTQPATVWEGRQYWLAVSPYATGAALAAFLSDPQVLRLAETICANWSYYDTDRRGQQTDAGLDALEELEQRADAIIGLTGQGWGGANFVEVWQVDEWLQDTSEITADTTDAEIGDMAQDACQSAAVEQTLLVGDMLEHMLHIRNTKREEK